MREISKLEMIAMLMPIMADTIFIEDIPPKKKQLKKCLKCGSPHSHNNEFCSAECCRHWRAQRSKVGK